MHCCIAALTDTFSSITSITTTTTTVHPPPIISGGGSAARAVAGKSKQRGLLSPTLPKVIGGNPTPRNVYPWFTDLGGCGGVLISPTFVLTAAHCWMLILPNQRIKVGHLCSAADNCGQKSETITVYGTYIHPDYTWLSNSPSNDLMLVQLNQRSSIQPVKFDLGDVSPNYKSGKKLWTIGIGVIDSNTNLLASILKHAEIEYMPSDQCNTRYVDKITPSMMCAGFPGRDACQGDSGGPLYDQENDVLVGITSWGYECADAFYPGVYARIADQADWILSVICNESGSASSSSSSGSIWDTLDKPNFCQSLPTVSPVPTSAPTECIGYRVYVTIRTDFFPFETSWEIKDIRTGFVSASAAGFLQQYTTYLKKACLREDVCYQFTIYDTDGDGINVSDGYDLVVNGQEMSLSGPFDDSKEVIVFGNCNDCNPTQIQLILKTDDHGGETKWTISDTITGNQIYTGGFSEAFKDNTEYKFTLNVCRGCYVFRLYDTFGDGMKPPAGFTLSDGNMTFSGGEISYSDSIQFGNCSSICQPGDMEVSLDVNVWGNGAEMSWELLNKETSAVVATDRHRFSTDRFLCLPKNCYVFQSINSGKRGDAFALIGFEYWLRVDGETIVSQDTVGGNFPFGCPTSTSSGSNIQSLWNVSSLIVFVIFAMVVMSFSMGYI